MSDDGLLLLAIAGFRGSAKSTIVSLVFILYEALIKQNPFIIPINETDDACKITIANLREELENNELLVSDFGSLVDKSIKSTKFTETNLLLGNGVRLMSRSRGQKIRGLRHRQYRPSLVVIDDPEELERINSKTYRDKTERWIRGSILPAIEETKARLVVIANVLHADSIMPRLKKDDNFVYREYPLIDLSGKCTWQGKYPNEAALMRQQKKVGPTAWLREYLLKIVPEEGQVVKEEWLQYYDKLPSHISEQSGTVVFDIIKVGVGVDLAISKAETADYTTMVSGALSIVDGIPKIHILPHPVNEHLSFNETMDKMKDQKLALRLYTSSPIFFVEDVAYQKAAIQEAQRRMLAVVPMRAGADKTARFKTAATYIQNGTVLFPRRGCEALMSQMLGFGVEEHDDLVDSLVYLILGLADEGMEMLDVIIF